ncbi:S41 family peptidase [Candidatus Leptofilum sp.]|uniref:S41 family peptidase n=1 Tax=Candidatus Leptofilum sp. TaxID=3241576 RepID=UPI003B593F43
MQLLEQIADAIRERYILVDEAENVIAALQTHRETVEAQPSPQHVAMKLTQILREITNDNHFALMHVPETAVPAPNQLDLFAQSARHNHYFYEAKRLAGNIGYLDMRMFAGSQAAMETAVAALGFLAHSDALIFDLRQNHGGMPQMIQLIISYLVAEPTLINTFYERVTDEHRQSWTLPFVPGKKLINIPVYVLISHTTGSAAEEFAYDLQQMERATLVGETTVGAGHTISAVSLDDGFLIHVPSGRPINPISGTGWQGVGVQPHIATDAAEALPVAHAHALESLLAQEAPADLQAFRQWELETVRANQAPIAVDNPSQYVGEYGQSKVILENGRDLRYQSPMFDQILVPIKEDVFALTDETRLTFTKNEMIVSWRDQPNKMRLPKVA